jgi:hypothetical protein
LTGKSAKGSLADAFTTSTLAAAQYNFVDPFRHSAKRDKKWRNGLASQPSVISRLAFSQQGIPSIRQFATPPARRDFTDFSPKSVSAHVLRRH